MGKLFIFGTSKPTTMKRIFLFALLILVFASGCREISGRKERGSGNIKTDTRNASGFHSVHVSGDIDVFLKQDSSTTVKVEADDNLLEYIEVYTDNSTLIIRTQSGVRLRPSNKIKVWVSNPSYRELKVSGASSMQSETRITSTEGVRVGISGASEGRLEIDAPRVSVEISGASNLTIRGRTKDLEAGSSGASHIKCFDLLAENTEVEASGASSAEVYASVRLEGRASGASQIKYKGKDRKSTRLNSSHSQISYAVFCLKKKKN